MAERWGQRQVEVLLLLSILLRLIPALHQPLARPQRRQQEPA